MNDLISRQAAKHALCRAVHKNEDIPCENQTASCLWSKTRVCDYAREIDALPSAQQKLQWIPVSERLPEKGKEVLVCYNFKGHRSVLIGTLYGDGKFYGYDDEYLTPEGRRYRKAVAWMPLPEPYAERREE